MKRYKLLKDTPVLKAGTIFKEHISDFDKSRKLVRITPENSEVAPMWTISDIDNFNEWFEEIPEEYERWRAEFRGNYYYYKEGLVYNSTEMEFRLDGEYYAIGNYFETGEEAEKYGKYLKALQVIKDDAKGFEPDWNDEHQIKHYGGYDYSSRDIEIDFNFKFKNQGTVYFEFQEDIEESFKKHRKEWLIVLGVEEAKNESN